MKALASSVLLFFAALSALSAQHYYVLSVTGEVTADGKALQKKDKLSETAELRFGSPEAFVYVIAPGKGYYILSGKKAAPAGDSEIVLALREALLPPNEYRTTSTKSGAMPSSFSFDHAGQLRSFFRGPVLLIGPTTFEVDPVAFPLDERHYFQLTHTLPEGIATQRLAGENGRFRIDASVYQTAAGTIDPAVVRSSALAYIDEVTRNRLPLGSFNLHLLPRASALEELALLHDAVAPVAPDVFFLEHAKPYLRNTYGETDWRVVRQLIVERFGEE